MSNLKEAISFVAKIAKLASDAPMDNQVRQYVQSDEVQKILESKLEVLRKEGLLSLSYEEELENLVADLIESTESHRSFYSIFRQVRNSSAYERLPLKIQNIICKYVPEGTCKNPGITTCNSFPCQC